MDAVLYILALAGTGLVVGALARLGLPGRDPMSIFQTMLVGVAGSLIAGLITYYLFDSEAGPGILLSVLCSLVIVFAVRKIRERQLGGAAHAQPQGPGLGGGGFGGSGMKVSFMPGCLVTSLLFSVILTVLLNLLLRAF
jgi:uncharacterized membrane protein YeaQ/YmgE (transglycosylase-associated protein family)